MARFFGMVSTAASLEYTRYALKSFFQTTKLQDGDSFLLIDNDKCPDFTQLVKEEVNTRIETLVHSKPHSFAANINLALNKASEAGDDLYFLNNDLIFTPDWDSELYRDGSTISVSASNQNYTYRTQNFNLDTVLSLEEYLKHVPDFNYIVKTHLGRVSGFRSVITTPYYCVLIPAKVYRDVGLFDEGFLKGGGEDTDYSLRAYEKNYSVTVALRSYILHFVGRSTWRGGESDGARTEREKRYLARLSARWGKELTKLLVTGTHPDPEIVALYNAGDGKEVLKRLN